MSLPSSETPGIENTIQEPTKSHFVPLLPCHVECATSSSAPEICPGCCFCPLFFHPSSGQLLLSLWASSLYMCALGLSSGATSSWKPSQTSLPLKSGLNTPPLGSDPLYPSPMPPCRSIKAWLIMDCKCLGTLFLPLERGLANYSP